MHPRFLYDLDDCSIRRALEEVGEAWILLILREAIYGVRRFDDFARALGCGRGVLSDRLKKLIAAGVMERRSYVEEPARRPAVRIPSDREGRGAVPGAAGAVAVERALVAAAERTRGHHRRKRSLAGPCARS